MSAAAVNATLWTTISGSCSENLTTTIAATSSAVSTALGTSRATPHDAGVGDDDAPLERFETASGLIVAAAGAFGLLENAAALAMFARERVLANRTAALLCNLAVSDGLMALVGCFMFAASSFAHGWIWGAHGCEAYGFIVYALAVTDVATLCAIAVDRYVAVVLVHADSRRRSQRLTGAVLALTWAYGILWAVMPLLGLSSYTLEGRTSCSVNWVGKTRADVAYVAASFVGAYFLPLFVITGCYANIWLVVRRSRIRVAGPKGTRSDSKLGEEWRLAGTLLASIACYIVMWTPYAVASFVAAFGNLSEMSATVQTLPALFAKVSMSINPIVYLSLNKVYRKKIIAMFSRSTNSASTVVPAVAGSSDSGETGVTRHSHLAAEPQQFTSQKGGTGSLPGTDQREMATQHSPTAHPAVEDRTHTFIANNRPLNQRPSIVLEPRPC